MFLKYLILAVGLGFSGQLLAIPAAISCYLTLAKESCWLKYNVSVNVIDAQTNKVLITVGVPAGTAWVRQPFPCLARENLMFNAKFAPVFWAEDKDKVFSGKDFWSLPSKINPGDSAWNENICFPKDFAEVPLPPDNVTKGCECDFKSIPAILPKQVNGK